MPICTGFGAASAVQATAGGGGPNPIRTLSRVQQALLAVAMSGLALGPLGGCAEYLRKASGPTTQSDRLKAAYSDLSTGRFWVMADFEQLDHYQIFHVDSPSGSGTCIPSDAAGVPETGQGCLRVTLADPSDALVISNERASSWSLRRDWRDFHLLLGAVWSAAGPLSLDLSIIAGPNERASTIQTRLELERGWNVVRLDLAEAAERIPIDDVRELRFTLPEANGPTELVFDDLLLADNRETLWGSPEDPAEGLYVQREGRRLKVGAAGRFEFGFANGQIVQWFDLGSDPHRLDNLADGGVLGPYPVVLPASSEGPPVSPAAGFAPLGETIVAHQQVIEANAVRIIVGCTFRFTSGGRKPDRDSPFQQWTYTILRSGHVYVHFECTTESGDWAPENLGLVVSRTDPPRAGPLQTFAYPEPTTARADRAPYVAYALARPEADDRPGLVMAVLPMPQIRYVDVARHEAPPGVDLIASCSGLDRPTQAWSCLLNIWPAAAAEPDAAEALATDYCHPMPPDIQVGRLVTDSAGDDNRDGFNERFGTYVLEPEGDLVRFEVGGTGQQFACPAFSVRATAGNRAWVYVNNRIHQPVARDHRGNVLFQVCCADVVAAGRQGGPVLVEVVARRE